MTDTTTLDEFLTDHLYDYARMSSLYPEAMPSEAHRYTCSDEFIRDAKRYGHFFDESTMRAFNTKVYDLLGERFLILSDKFEDSARQYRVAFIYQHKPSCDNPQHIHKSVDRLETHFPSLTAARKAARELVRLLDAAA